MPEAKPNRILVAITSCDHYPGTEVPTGLWLSELVHFIDVLDPAGFDCDLVSPRGGRVPLEPKSLRGLFYDKASKRRHEDPEFMKRLQDTRAAADVDPADYAAIYYAGGHGTMGDFREDEHLQRICRVIHEAGGVVSAVCHGYCGLLDVTLSDGQPLIRGKRMTGFTWLEEILAGVAKKVPYNAEAVAKERGANFRRALLPFMARVEADGRLVTGQNPASATGVARKVAKLLGIAGPGERR